MEQWEFVVGAVCGGFALVILFSFCRRCLGFTSSGVEAGSHAAAIHSGIGNVEKGSVFAWCQSGTSCCSNLFLFFAGAAISVGLMYFYDWASVKLGFGNSTSHQSNATDFLNTTISS